jgi:hypothetical protein
MTEPLSSELRIEQIERRAYEFYLARNCEPGREIEDWLKAEKDLIFESVLMEAEVYFRSAAACN